MAQPIRKIIQETHPDKLKKESFITLLVDGNSLLYNCMADTKVNTNGVHYGGVFQFLLQLKMLMEKRDYSYVYVTFDNEYSGWMRWKEYPLYKANRDKHYADYGQGDYYKEYMATLKNMQSYIFNKGKKEKQSSGNSYEDFIDANFDRERDILCRYFNELYIRWFLDEIVEGDDLIAYYVSHKKENEKIVIVSSDMDLTQLLSDDVIIYNQHLKKHITKDNFKDIFGYHYENTLVKKVFCGDSSDNIGNIKGLSEDGFAKLMPEYKERAITIEEVKERAQELINERISNKKKPLKVHENIVNGVSNQDYNGKFYETNEKIIDLKHPLLTEEAIEELESVMYAPQDPEDRGFANLYKMIIEDGIDELCGDTKFAVFFKPFKKLEEKEIERYKSDKI